MSSPSALSEYLALWQSLVGALGALAVASFTVWRTNKHAADRETRQELQLRKQERQKVLREKLEGLVNDCETCYRLTSGSTRTMIRAAEAVRKKMSLPAETVNTVDVVASMSSAVVAARIYFPPIADLVYAFNRELSQYSSAAGEHALAVATDPTRAVDPPVSIAKLKELRFSILDEARKLIESDFASLIQ